MVDNTYKIVGKFTGLDNRQIVSIEVLFNTAVQQAENDLAALGVLCPQGDCTWVLLRKSPANEKGGIHYHVM